MKNFPFYKNGKEFWYSRSNVCSGYVFCCFYGVWYVLAAQRGSTQTNPHYWNVPGGFLDHNETLVQCAKREIFEETGLDINEDELFLYEITDKPIGNLQHIVFSYYANMGDVKILPSLSRNYNEPGETTHVTWIDINHVRNWKADNPWLRGHRERILKIFDEIINPSNKGFRSIVDKIKKSLG